MLVGKRWGKAQGYICALATLVCSHGPQDMEDNYPLAACLLGWLHLYGEGGLDQSLCLARHYLQRSADGGHYRAFFYLAKTLIDLGKLQYDSNIFIPGYSPVPKALYWYRESLEHAIIEGEEGILPLVRTHLKELEASVQDHCANCDKKANALPKGDKLKCCVRCHAAWYCSKDCQVEHWRAGHKNDCFKPKQKNDGRKS